MSAEAGAYDQRVQIWRLDAAAKNALGETPKAYSLFYSCWAIRNYMSRAERLAAAAETATQTVKFTVRSCSEARSITPKDRLKWKGRDFNIRSAEDNGLGDVDIYVEGVVA